MKILQLFTLLVPLIVSSVDNREKYRAAFEQTNLTAVKADLRALFRTSQTFWPADYGNYGPFFIRMAWHMAGTYRVADGRGGIDGARQRFPPESLWNDNGNLDKARKMLEPIKVKYGDGISWADLFALTGDTAIESMGSPILGFCAGRMDDVDGSDSAPLGNVNTGFDPTYPCSQDGNCTNVSLYLGSTSLGDIYVNPEGPMGNPEPTGSVSDVRVTFQRMGMNDRETVALIGGGHAFGKTHGACDTPNCGTNGANTVTSGFEGPWTVTPTVWSNSYFKQLNSAPALTDWEKHLGPGGRYQWRKKLNPPTTPAAHNLNEQQPLMMLTADLALLADASYKRIVEEFANNETALEEAWTKAWYKLMTRDMGPRNRCFNADAPPVQDFQKDLPKASDASLNVDFTEIRAKIKNSSSIDFINLAFECANTWRRTDYRGGCNGARILLPGMTKNSIQSVDVDTTWTRLLQFQQAYPAISKADLIVLAGNTALEILHGIPLGTLKFCPGRTDATEDDPLFLPPYDTWSAADQILIKGQTREDFVSLSPSARNNLTVLAYASYDQDMKDLVTGKYASKDSLKADQLKAWEKLMHADALATGYGTPECLNGNTKSPTNTSGSIKKGTFGFSSVILGVLVCCFLQ